MISSSNFHSHYLSLSHRHSGLSGFKLQKQLISLSLTPGHFRYFVLCWRHFTLDTGG